jgi:hypothetical protein
LIAFEAGIPRAERMLSACSFTSGSILAYTFADFTDIYNTSLLDLISFIIMSFVNTIAIHFYASY